jgi:hypothetical protein
MDSRILRRQSRFVNLWRSTHEACHLLSPRITAKVVRKNHDGGSLSSAPQQWSFGSGMFRGFEQLDDNYDTADSPVDALEHGCFTG